MNNWENKEFRKEYNKNYYISFGKEHYQQTKTKMIDDKFKKKFKEVYGKMPSSDNELKQWTKEGRFIFYKVKVG